MGEEAAWLASQVRACVRAFVRACVRVSISLCGWHHRRVCSVHSRMHACMCCESCCSCLSRTRARARTHTHTHTHARSRLLERYLRPYLFTYTPSYVAALHGQSCVTHALDFHSLSLHILPITCHLPPPHQPWPHLRVLPPPLVSLLSLYLFFFRGFLPARRGSSR